MEKHLNIEKIQMAMDDEGLNQSSLATRLDVSRAIVSEWLKGSKFPRPEKLLKLGMALGLSFSELVIKSTENEPIVAFRRKAGRKTQDHHFESAKDMGHLLEGLVPFLSFSRLTNTPSLKNARLEYAYLQEVSQIVRKEIGVSKDEPIQFENLLRFFKKFDAVLIPALWGKKANHGNALHIHLPRSGTTWIYLNLDSNFHDFHFWMAHELGHVLAQLFEGEEAENFSDAFAQALLFPEHCAENAYADVKSTNNVGNKIKKIIELADTFDISPITVYESINNYAYQKGLPKINLGQSFYGATTNFHKGFYNVSDALGDKKKLTPKKYIEIGKTYLESPFFDALRDFLKETEKGPGIIQNLLQVDFLDAKGIYKELVS